MPISLRRTCLTAALMLGVLAGPSAAQHFTLDAMVAALLPVAVERGVGRPTGGTASGGIPAALPTAQLLVNFEGDSPRLTVEGMRTLRTLARALEDPRLAGSRIEVVGHAFIPAAPLSSTPVSARRAQTVAEHLVGFYGINPALVSSRGVGALQAQGAPENPLNQRIEIVNLGGL